MHMLCLAYISEPSCPLGSLHTGGIQGKITIAISWFSAPGLQHWLWVVLKFHAHRESACLLSCITHESWESNFFYSGPIVQCGICCESWFCQDLPNINLSAIGSSLSLSLLFNWSDHMFCFCKIKCIEAIGVIFSFLPRPWPAQDVPKKYTLAVETKVENDDFTLHIVLWKIGMDWFLAACNVISIWGTK